MSIKRTGILSFVFALGSMQFAAAGESAGPEIWMCKSNPWELAESREWKFVRENVDGIKIYIDEMKKASKEQMRALTTVLNENDINK